MPNTTKALKAEKTKISKNKFKPKNVFCISMLPSVKGVVMLIMLTRTNERIKTSNIHLNSATKTLDNIVQMVLIKIRCKIEYYNFKKQSPYIVIFLSPKLVIRTIFVEWILLTTNFKHLLFYRL